MPNKKTKEEAVLLQKKKKSTRTFRPKPIDESKVCKKPRITVVKKYGRFNKFAKDKGWLKHPTEASHGYPFEVYDTTSGGVMHELSPMHLGPVVDEFGDVLGCNIEDCWQGQKVWNFHMNGGKFNPKNKANLWEDGDKDEWIEEEWQKWSDHICWSGEAKRHRAKIDPTSENPNAPLFSYYRGKHLPYEIARQAMYCRWYDTLVRETKAFKYLKKRFEAGTNLVLLDTDGQPRDEEPEAVTKESALKRIDDKNEIFGHGFVLACALQDIDVWSKIKIY